MLLNYCYWSPRGLRASHNKLFVHCVPRPFRRLPSGSRVQVRALQHRQFSKIDSLPCGVANEGIVYQTRQTRARGKMKKNKKSCKTPSREMFNASYDQDLSECHVCKTGRIDAVEDIVKFPPHSSHKSSNGV